MKYEVLIELYEDEIEWIDEEDVDLSGLAEIPADNSLPTKFSELTDKSTLQKTNYLWWVWKWDLNPSIPGSSGLAQVNYYFYKLCDTF